MSLDSTVSPSPPSAVPDSAWPRPLAELALRLSYSTYCSTLDTSFSCYFCKTVARDTDVKDFQVVNTFGDPNNSYFGLVGYSVAKQQVAVVFRGTHNVAGWITDGMFFLKDLPGAPSGVQVHGGFLDAVTAVQPAFLSLYTQAQAQCGGSCTLLVTGHSLGAAMAMIGSHFLAVATGMSVPMDVVGFGVPRPGNPAFVQWYLNTYSAPNGPVRTIYRVTNNRDPVPHMPPRNILGAQFHHFPLEIFQHDGVFSLCNTEGEDPACGDSVHVFEPKDHGKYLYFFVDAGLPDTCGWVAPANPTAPVWLRSGTLANMNTMAPIVPAWAIAVIVIGALALIGAVVVIVVVAVRRYKRTRGADTDVYARM